MRSNDELFREIADKYTEKYGAALHDELSKLELDPAAAPPTIKLESRIHKRIAAEKRKPFIRGGAVLAACLAIVLLLPYMLNLSKLSPSTSNDTAPMESTVPEAPVQDMAPKPKPEFAVIPLAASLPDGFYQSGFEQDREKSIYYIEDAFMDNVVLTLEQSRALPDTGGLVEIALGDTIAYGTQTDGYSLLTFQRGAVVYEMTCRYDINTLIELGYALV